MGRVPTPITCATVARVKWSVVILNWKAAGDTASCVRAVQVWGTTRVVERPTIWVVDNNSRLPVIEQIRRGFPDASIIRSPRNRGFARGNNLGIATALASGSGAVLLLNNDASLGRLLRCGSYIF